VGAEEAARLARQVDLEEAVSQFAQERAAMAEQAAQLAGRASRLAAEVGELQQQLLAAEEEQELLRQGLDERALGLLQVGALPGRGGRVPGVPGARPSPAQAKWTTPRRLQPCWQGALHQLAPRAAPPAGR
jgi:hypothetical protein